MGQVYILVEAEEKRQTLQTALQDKCEVIVVPAIAAVVEAKNIDHLARGEEGFLFRPVTASHDVLKKLLQNDQEDIYLAFDRSERGEYSSWLWAGMIGQLSKGALQCRRLHLASLNAEGVAKAMKLVEPVDSGQAACFYFEECFQRCLATHLQRLLGTRSGPGGIKLSIPVLAILALLAEREQEVREFSVKPKWHVELSLKGSNGEFPAQLKEVFGVCCDGNLEGREQAKEVAGDLVGQSFQVVSRQENSLEIPAPLPYTFYDLVFDAFVYCQIPVAVAMKAAMALFHGVSVDGRPRSLISSLYPVALGNVQPLVEAVQQQVVSRFGEEALQSRPLTEYGILPLNPQMGPEDLAGLPDVVQKIYDLVWRRALASQMKEGIGKEIVLDLKTEKYQLQSDCREIEDPGFLQVYQYGFSDVLSARVDDTLQEGDEVTVAQVVPAQHFSRVSDRYTLPNLADDLHELGITRQEEVVENIGRLCAAGYVDAQGNGSMQCDSNLFKVANTLNRAFPGMQGLHLVVYYAQTIDEVASGRKRFQMAFKQFDQNLIMQGNPLVKVKLPTSLPQRLKKSKSIIKTDGPQAPRAKAAPPAPEKKVLFTDFSKQAEEGEVQVPEAPDEAAPAIDLQEEVASPPEPIQESESGPDDVEEASAQEVEGVSGEEEQAAPEQEGDTILLDEEAEAQAAEAPAKEAEKLFEEAEEKLPEPSSVQPETRDALADSGPPLTKEDKGKDVAEVAIKPCPECGRAMVPKGDRFGKYWACTGIPACQYTEGDISKEDGKDSFSCPLCHQGKLVVKRTPTGKDMYVCPRESCEFMAWSKPHAIHCPLCSSPFLVEKKGVGGKVSLRCPKAGCNYSQGVDGSKEQGVPVKKKKVVVRRKKGGSAGGGKRKVVVRRRKK